LWSGIEKLLFNQKCIQILLLSLASKKLEINIVLTLGDVIFMCELESCLSLFSVFLGEEESSGGEQPSNIPNWENNDESVWAMVFTVTSKALEELSVSALLNNPSK
jgi:hypothetical protein